MDQLNVKHLRGFYSEHHHVGRNLRTHVKRCTRCGHSGRTFFWVEKHSEMPCFTLVFMSVCFLVWSSRPSIFVVLHPWIQLASEEINEKKKFQKVKFQKAKVLFAVCWQLFGLHR